MCGDGITARGCIIVIRPRRASDNLASEFLLFDVNVDEEDAENKRERERETGIKQP